MRFPAIFLASALLTVFLAPMPADAMSKQSARYKRWLREGKISQAAVLGVADDYQSCGTGRLAARVGAQGRITGFTCTFDPDHVCYAGLDGRFQTCTFPPDLRPFPGPVSAAVLRNPSMVLRTL